MWNEFVNQLINLLTFLTGIFGHNIGLAILVATILVRFALLPLSVKIAYGTFRRQKRLDALQPEIDTIKSNHRDNPELISRKTLDVYNKHGIAPVDGKNLLGGLIQAPVFIAMYSAIRKFIVSGGSFLWIQNVASPDFILTIIAAALTGIAALLGPNMSQQSRTIMMWLPVFLTVFFLWHLSAGIGIYWVGSNLVSVVQSLLIRKKVREFHGTAGVIK